MASDRPMVAGGGGSSALRQKQGLTKHPLVSLRSVKPAKQKIKVDFPANRMRKGTTLMRRKLDRESSGDK